MRLRTAGVTNLGEWLNLHPAVSAKFGMMPIGLLDSPEVVTQQTTFAPGAASGWHSHPGYLTATVVSGQVVRYGTDCSSQTFGAGQSFYETGAQHVHRQEPGHDDRAVVIVTFVVPGGTPTTALRIDKPQPDNLHRSDPTQFPAARRGEGRALRPSPSACAWPMRLAARLRSLRCWQRLRRPPSPGRRRPGQRLPAHQNIFLPYQAPSPAVDRRARAGRGRTSTLHGNRVKVAVIYDTADLGRDPLALRAARRLRAVPRDRARPLVRRAAARRDAGRLRHLRRRTLDRRRRSRSCSRFPSRRAAPTTSSQRATTALSDARRRPVR